MFNDAIYVDQHNTLTQVDQKTYSKLVKEQQKNYFDILKTLNFGKMKFGNLHPDYPIPSDCLDYIRDWMGTIPVGVLPLYARNGDDGIDINGIGIETKTMIIDESLWELGPRGGIRAKCESGGSMGSYLNIGYGTDNGLFDANIKFRPTYVTILSKQLGAIVAVFYLEASKVVSLLEEYNGTHPKIHLWKILEHGSEHKIDLPAHGWDNYITHLKSTLPQTGRRSHKK